MDDSVQHFFFSQRQYETKIQEDPNRQPLYCYLFEEEDVAEYTEMIEVDADQEVPLLSGPFNDYVYLGTGKFHGNKK